MTRPVRPSEVPRFGSVWRYGGHDHVYIAVALRERPSSMVMLVAVGVSIGIITKKPLAAEIQDGMAWGFRDGGGLHATQGWVCIDEGPA